MPIFSSILDVKINRNKIDSLQAVPKIFLALHNGLKIIFPRYAKFFKKNFNFVTLCV